MGHVISFAVYGKPQQRGSKTPWLPRSKDGSLVVKNGRPVIATMDANKNSKAWMQAVRQQAAAAHRGPLLSGPIRLTARFAFARPQAHFGSGRNAGKLKASAPVHHVQTPDLAKLLRAIEDAMTGVCYRDDRQVYQYGAGTGKYWSAEAAGVRIVVEELAEPNHEDARHDLMPEGVL